MVVTTDAYTYMGAISEVLNEGLPRAARNIIGDNANRSLASKHELSHALIPFRTILGLIVSIAFATARQFADAFVSIEVREACLTYVRISAFSALSSAIETAVAAATRALSQPDVPLIISSVKFAVSIILDIMIISKYCIGAITPSANTQATTQLACGPAAAFAGLAYFMWTTKTRLRKADYNRSQEMPLSLRSRLSKSSQHQELSLSQNPPFEMCSLCG